MSILQHIVRFNKPVTFTDTTGISFVNTTTAETASLVAHVTASPAQTITYNVTWAVDPLPNDQIEWRYAGGNYQDEEGEAIDDQTLLLRNCDRVTQADVDFAAQLIRDNAGLQPGETAGLEAGVTAGLLNEAILVNQPRLLINNESVAQNNSDSGTGTDSDPYLFLNRDIDATEGANTGGINWFDAATTYHCKFVNCRITGYNVVQVRMSAPAGSKLTFENCEIYSPTTNGIDVQNGNTLIFDKSVITQTSNYGIVPFNTSWTGVIEVSNSIFNDSKGAWGGTAAAIASITSSSGTFNIRHCEFRGASLNAGIRLSDNNVVTVDNCLFDGAIRGIADLGTDNLPGATINNCVFRNMLNSNVNLRNVDGVNFSYCEFYTTPDGFRAFEFQTDGDATGTPAATQFARNCELYRCYAEKTIGAPTPNNEALEFFDTQDCGFRECWINGAVEDGYEIVRPQGQNYIINCVCDNSDVEAVNPYQTHATPGSILIENVYGRVADGYGLVNQGVSNVTVRNFYIENNTPGNTALALILNLDEPNTSGDITNNFLLENYTTNQNRTSGTIFLDQSTGTNNVDNSFQVIY